jgi:hypothetical protein
MAKRPMPAEAPVEVESKSATVVVHYGGADGEACGVDIPRGQERMYVPGGTLFMCWGGDGQLLSSRFEATAPTPAEQKRELQDVPLATLKERYAAHRVKIRAVREGAPEAEKVANEIAARIGKAQVTIGGETFAAKRTHVRKEGAPPPKYPLTLSEVTRRAEYEGA